MVPCFIALYQRNVYFIEKPCSSRQAGLPVLELVSVYEIRLSLGLHSGLYFSHRGMYTTRTVKYSL